MNDPVFWLGFGLGWLTVTLFLGPLLAWLHRRERRDLLDLFRKGR